MTSHVLYYQDETCHAPEETKYQVLSQLLESGYTVECTDTEGAIRGERSFTTVIGNFVNQVPEKIQNFEDVQIVDIEKQDTWNEFVQKDESKKHWKPWFPVIDYDRCTNCMQCMNFCLFGVYGLSEEKKLQVQKAKNCKTDCPACSRVCPEAAIMFPKYKSGPINGDEVTEDDLHKEKMKIDITSLLGGDIYDALRQRSEQARSRFSRERDEDRALKERRRCLKKLQQDLDIPDSVLNSLPIPKNLSEE